MNYTQSIHIWLLQQKKCTNRMHVLYRQFFFQFHIYKLRGVNAPQRTLFSSVITLYRCFMKHIRLTHLKPYSFAQRIETADNLIFSRTKFSIRIKQRHSVIATVIAVKRFYNMCEKDNWMLVWQAFMYVLSRQNNNAFVILVLKR